MAPTDDAETTSIPTPIKWLHSGPGSLADWFPQDKEKEQKNYDTGGVSAPNSPKIKSNKNGYRMQSSC